MSELDRTITLVEVAIPGGEVIQATKSDGQIWVAVKPICNVLKVDTWGQQQRLNRSSWAVTCIMQVTAADGKTYQTTVITVDTMLMWLATIDENRVAPEARPTLIAFQREAKKALDAYFNGTVMSIDVDMNDPIAVMEAANLRWQQAIEIAKSERAARLEAEETVTVIEGELVSEREFSAAIKPYAESWYDYHEAHHEVLPTEAAHLLMGSGVSITANRLLLRLRDEGNDQLA